MVVICGVVDAVAMQNIMLQIPYPNHMRKKLCGRAFCSKTKSPLNTRTQQPLSSPAYMCGEQTQAT
jgi:hypothetical protein